MESIEDIVGNIIRSDFSFVGDADKQRDYQPISPKLCLYMESDVKVLTKRKKEESATPSDL